MGKKVHAVMRALKLWDLVFITVKNQIVVSSIMTLQSLVSGY